MLDMGTDGARRRVALFVATLLAASLSSVLTATAPGATNPSNASNARNAGAPSRPNILLVVADDQASSVFNRSLMPNVFSQLVDQGVSFDRAYVNTSLCCPSRSQMFTGLYATDTNVSTNFDPLARPTLIEAMHDSGYRTMVAGKYLNSHPCEDVRAEFDEWYCYGGGTAASGEKDPVINVNGTETPFTGYSADILAGDVSHFISTTPADQPFLAMYTPKDPHAPANDDRFDDLPVPPYRPPNFDEDTTSDDKPQYLQRDALSSREIAQIDSNYQAMYRSSRGLDNAVGTILSSLGSRAANTVVIYVSDNGFFYGEHRRVEGKIAPYEESVKVPMIVRDPALHSTSNPVASRALVENVDIGATIAERAGIDWHTDGKSLVPIIGGAAATIRDAALIEHCVTGAGPACWPSGTHLTPIFVGIVTDRYKYLEYATGEKELYDLASDPYELLNHARDPDWAATVAELASQLAALRAIPPPETTIATGPQAVVGPGTQRFTYFSPAVAATYTCRLSSADDPGNWAPCDWQSTTVGPLGTGTYTFAVAGEADGVVDPTPAARSFSVDGSLPAFSVADASVDEGAASTARHLSFSISLSHASTRAVTVSYRTDDGTARSGRDFTAKWGATTIAAGHTVKVVSVPVAADRLHEADETLRLRLRNPVGGVLDLATATGTIVDDDPVPTVSVGKASATEGTGEGGVVTLPVRLSVPSGLAVTVHCDTQPGTARAADYTARHQVVTLTAGRTVGFVSVPVVGDALNEANEKFSLALSRPVGAKIGTASAAATINDDDPVPSVSIGDGSVVEGDSGELTTISFPLTLSAKSGRPITLAYNTADDTAQAPGDYLAASGTVTIKAGTVESSISVPVVGDGLTEGDERFALDLSAPLHVTIERADATGTVHDDESPPQISVTDTHVTEGDGGSVAAQFTVSLSVPSSNAVRVDYATADGTATAPADYSATSGTITFAPGRTEETIDVPVIGDALIETDETFTLTLTNPVNATLGTATATGTIADDDSRPAVSVSNAPDVSEGDSGTIDAVFSVSLDATTTRDVSVDFATVDSSAVAPDDYLATSGTATIPAGSTGTTIAVPVVGDTRYESVEIFSLELSNPVNSTLGTDSASATVVDDDPPPTITISNNVVVTEGDTDTTDAVFTVQLSTASGLTTTADFQTSDITASAPGDYASSSGTVTIRPGATTATFSVPVNGDALYEGDERFLVVLADATNGTVSDDDYGAYGIIEDDDPAPTISVADPTVVEGDSGTTNAQFTVSITEATGLDTTVGYTTNDGTAVAPDDYAETAGIITIPAGTVSATVEVPVNGDTLVEGDETFSLTITDATNAVLGTDTAPATIVDDESPVGSDRVHTLSGPTRHSVSTTFRR